MPESFRVSFTWVSAATFRKWMGPSAQREATLAVKAGRAVRTTV